MTSQNATKWSTEDEAWQAAYAIAWIGASNPLAVQNTISRFGDLLSFGHPAVVAMSGHLAFLYGHGLGPEFDELEAVRDNARRLGIDTH